MTSKLSEQVTAMVDELLNNQCAASLLREMVTGRTTEQWLQWLQNNRNPARRSAYRIPFEKMGGAVMYRRSELAKFIEWENSRNLGAIKLTGRAAEVMQAFGIGSATGSTTGRKFQQPNISVQVDQASKEIFLQMIQPDPLLVFRLSVDEAERFAQDLADTVRNAKRIRDGS